MNERGCEVRMEAVSFSYGETEMFFDVTAEPASIVAVMGASGSGKSTLLSLIAGFEKPASGRILIGGDDFTQAPPARRPVSMVFQENNLFAHLDVAANVGLGRSPSLRLGAEDHAEIAAALADVGLSGKERRRPAELSGGERQRVALARVLVRDRPVLLLDEPFGSLGPALRAEMLELVRGLHWRKRMTILMVTHHPDDARTIADTIVFLADGRVAASGPEATFFSPLAPAPFRDYLGR